jgi:hypothetical protein
MVINQKEPTDSESLWLKFCKLTPSIIGISRLVIDVVKLFLER